MEELGNKAGEVTSENGDARMPADRTVHLVGELFRIYPETDPIPGRGCSVEVVCNPKKEAWVPRQVCEAVLNRQDTTLDWSSRVCPSLALTKNASVEHCRSITNSMQIRRSPLPAHRCLGSMVFLQPCAPPTYPWAPDGKDPPLCLFTRPSSAIYNALLEALDLSAVNQLFLGITHTNATGNCDQEDVLAVYQLQELPEKAKERELLHRSGVYVLQKQSEDPLSLLEGVAQYEKDLLSKFFPQQRCCCLGVDVDRIWSVEAKAGHYIAHVVHVRAYGMHVSRKATSASHKLQVSKKQR